MGAPRVRPGPNRKERISHCEQSDDGPNAFSSNSFLLFNCFFFFSSEL